MSTHEEIEEIAVISSVAVAALFFSTREEIVGIYEIFAISTVTVVSLFLVFYRLEKRINRAARLRKGYKKEDAVLIGLSLGMIFGLIVSTLTDNIAIGTSVGVAIGMSMGALIEKESENKH